MFNLLFKSGSSFLVEKYLHQLAIDLKVSYDAIYNDYNIYFKQGSGQKNVEVLEETPNIIASGDCGDTVTWELTELNGNYTLTLSGTGETSNYGKNKYGIVLQRCDGIPLENICCE